MPVSRLHKASEVERKFKILSQQLYGKPEDQKFRRSDTRKSEESNRLTGLPVTSDHLIIRSSDTTYLKHDLLRIALLSTIAIGSQIALYIAINNNLIKLPI